MRIRVIVGAYLAACVVAAILLSACIAFSFGAHPVLMAMSVPFSTLFIAIFAALPASAAIYYAEQHGYRSPFFYVAAGFIIVVVAAVELHLVGGPPSPGRRHVPGPFRETMELSLLFGLFPGLAGSLTYWSIAGQKAGKAPFRVNRSAP